MQAVNRDDIYDVLIIGAGLSGIGTACHLARECPDKRVAIVERRECMGGTWDLFRYPGIRSDSDMLSFSYDFRPWNKLRTLADGPSIREYIRQTAAEHRLEDKIHYGLQVREASWDSREQCWTLQAVCQRSGEPRHFRSRFLMSCTGYYNYDSGYRPAFPEEQRFRGTIVHPQHWPEDLDYSGKRVLVIGSGATAVTLVPAMAGTAAHVTMLQRSPSYVYSLPGSDRLTGLLARLLPGDLAYRFARRRNILLQQLTFKACRRWPQFMRRHLLRKAQKQLGPDFDMRHFSPAYMPWDERLCAVPDGDLFRVLREGSASVATGHIECFTENGVKLRSGEELAADIIVTATGLDLQMMGGMAVRVDEQELKLEEQMTYRGALVQNLPNLAWFFGYTNASWTLKADLAGRYLCRLLKYMDARGLASVTPRAPAGESMEEGILDSLQAGYVQRGRRQLPRQGRTPPWEVKMDYRHDVQQLLERPVDDPCLVFVAAADKPASPASTAHAA
ncbi:flavin-containing monooxygenase [Parahaliea mediterranea]|uniref:flavin-containing monooxygenase n=1 Tax=Parahaliea mediterranea TaxID=651086 RepID=UPI000E2F62B6|nr:NAD(P)/FAD-dependent oxidoreductase [Parahaliea mediterranea]